jgi:hypothetical protein
MWEKVSKIVRAPKLITVSSLNNIINLISRQGSALLFNDGKHNLLVLPLQQCCLSKLSLATLRDLLSLQLDSMNFTNCFLFPLALLPELVILQVAVDGIHQPIYIGEFSIRSSMKW